MEQQRRRGMVWGLHLLVGVLGALLAVWVFGRATYSWGLVRVRLSVAPAAVGSTAIVLTPVGDISAQTHRTPVRVMVELERLNLNALRRLGREMPDVKSVVADLQRKATGTLRDYALRLLGLALVGGMLGSLALLRGPYPQHLASGGIGLAAVAVLLGLTGLTFRRDAFANPRYTGPIAEAPGAIRLARDGLARLDHLRGRMETIAAGVTRFYGSLEDARPGLPGENDIRVLHVSDIHSNPLGLDFIEQFTRRFRVDLIVDTGDLSDYGTEAEQVLLRPMRKLRVPELFVAGNHDSRVTVRALKHMERARVLEGEEVSRVGIRFMGWPDPVLLRAQPGPNLDATDEELDALEQRIREQVAAAPAKPDVLLVHNYRVGERLKGVAPVVLYGHNHRPGVRRVEGTVFVDAGTTGAGGARYFHSPRGIPYSAVVLHFSREHPGHLLAADVLDMRGPEGEFTLQRYTLNGLAKAEEEQTAQP